MAQKQFLTPPDLPSERWCRTLRMPASKEWLGIFNAALIQTLQAWQWEQTLDTDMTVEDAIAECQIVLNDFWSSLSCDTCVQPDGQPFMRVNEDGLIEQFNSEDWVEPYGEYELPPVPPREGGTDDEKRCLAAKNAAYVLQLTYENLTDSASAGLTTAEAITDFIIFLAGILLAPLSLVIAAIISAAIILFKVVYETAEFVTSDYWSEDFNNKLVCALLECADVDSEGVVTFDFDCFNTRLANRVDITTDYFELLLFGQIQAMLGFLGASGLNQAGATTSITEGECFCGWTYRWDFLTSDGGYMYDPDQSPYVQGTWGLGAGWFVQNTGLTNGDGPIYSIAIKSADFDIPSDCSIQLLRLILTNQVSAAHAEMFIGANRTAGLARSLKIYGGPGWSDNLFAAGLISGPDTGQHVGLEGNHNAADLFITAAEISGEGTPPDFSGGEFV